MNLIDQHGDEIEGERLPFYQNLKIYKPLCYSGKSIPTFLILRQNAFSTSLPCIVFINMLGLFVIIMQYIKTKGSNKDEQANVLRNVNIFAIALIDLFYLLTVILNPGIISEEDMELGREREESLSFCIRCNRKINEDMKHCIQCQTCVCDLDHHCGFFGKCIAGRQRFAFYAFLTFMFIGFISLLGSLSVLLTSV